MRGNIKYDDENFTSDLHKMVFIASGDFCLLVCLFEDILSSYFTRNTQFQISRQIITVCSLDQIFQGHFARSVLFPYPPPVMATTSSHDLSRD